MKTRKKSNTWKNASFRSSRPKVLCKKVVFKIFAKLAGKHLPSSLFFNKVADLRPSENLFCRSLPGATSEGYIDTKRAYSLHRQKCLKRLTIWCNVKAYLGLCETSIA